MKKKYFLLLMAALLMYFSGNAQSLSSEKIIKNFRLKAIDNKYFSTKADKLAKGYIVFFTCNKCPMAKLYSERMNQMFLKYKPKNVCLLAINAMDTVAYQEESFTLMQKKAKKEKFIFPYLQDKSQKIAKQFGATHTPQSYVLWKDFFGQWVVKYEGAIDDNALEPENANRFLENAVNELLNNQKVSISFTKSTGCRIFYRGEIAKMD